MKTLRLTVPLVLAAFTVTCQSDQTTAPGDPGIRAGRGGVPGPNPDRPGGGGGKEEDGAFALSFDGIAQHASTPDADDLDLTTTWTLEAWIKPSNVAASFQHIISKWNGDGDASYNMVVT